MTNFIDSAVGFFKSLFGGGSHKTQAQPIATPQFSNYQSTTGWQDTGFTSTYLQLGNSVSTQETGNNTVCGDCLDPKTIGKNFFGLSYPGPNNPKTINGDYSYSYVPSDLSEYPAIGHDRRYDKLKIQGASGLFFDSKAIGADYRFIYEEARIALQPNLPFKYRYHAGLLGYLLSIPAHFKTIIFMKTHNILEWYPYLYNWYQKSNIGVNNKPDHSD